MVALHPRSILGFSFVFILVFFVSESFEIPSNNEIDKYDLDLYLHL